MTEIFMPETSLNLEYYESVGLYRQLFEPAPFIPTAAQKLVVVLDGVEYKCDAIDLYGNDRDFVVGNASMMNVGNDTGEPFLIYVQAIRGSSMAIITQKPVAMLAVYLAPTGEISCGKLMEIYHMDGFEAAWLAYKRMKNSSTPTPEPVLPEDFTRLEYLESDGNQYIDTGILPTKYTEFELGAYCYSDHIVSGTAHCLMGMRLGNGNPNKEQWRMMVTNFLDKAYPWVGGYVSLGNNQRAQSTEVGINDYVFSYRNGIWSNGNNITKAIDIRNDVIPTADGTIPDDATLYLFKGNYIGESGDGNPCKDRIKSCKIWQQKRLVLDLVPVRDRRRQLGMYNLVNGDVFYNNGSGTFIAGPEV